MHQAAPAVSTISSRAPSASVPGDHIESEAHRLELDLREPADLEPHGAHAPGAAGAAVSSRLAHALGERHLMHRRPPRQATQGSSECTRRTAAPRVAGVGDRDARERRGQRAARGGSSIRSARRCGSRARASASGRRGAPAGRARLDPGDAAAGGSARAPIPPPCPRQQQRSSRRRATKRAGARDGTGATSARAADRLQPRQPPVSAGSPCQPGWRANRGRRRRRQPARRPGGMTRALGMRTTARCGRTVRARGVVGAHAADERAGGPPASIQRSSSGRDRSASQASGGDAEGCTAMASAAGSGGSPARKASEPRAAATASSPAPRRSAGPVEQRAPGVRAPSRPPRGAERARRRRASPPAAAAQAAARRRLRSAAEREQRGTASAPRRASGPAAARRATSAASRRCDARERALRARPGRRGIRLQGHDRLAASGRTGSRACSARAAPAPRWRLHAVRASPVPQRLGSNSAASAASAVSCAPCWSANSNIGENSEQAW